MKKILVTGGTGYIGSHTIVDLIQAGYQVVSVDNLMNSDESVLDAIEQITGARVQNFRMDLSDSDAAEFLKRELGTADGVIHFAALKSVGESVEKPLLYYQNNLNSLIQLLHWVEECRIPHFIFSSSCTVYGDTSVLPVLEDLPFQPTGSPYGRSKQMCEEIIRDFYRMNTSGRKAISLRYFNPAGAHESGLMGESPINPPQNLVPAITETAIGRRKELTVFGSDYPTRDGSCIRDYVHVMDLARAHTLALRRLESGAQTEAVDAINLGIGQGVTVMEAIRAFEESTGEKLAFQLGPRRPGDLAAVYADNRKAADLLDWHPRRDIHQIMHDAWAWEKARR
jgi:UDP-glucose 4-epimerase